MSDGSPLGRLDGVAVSRRWVAVAALLSLLLVLVSSANAHAALAPDGMLTGESGGEGHFGQSVALAGNGSTAVVGAPTASGEAGAVWVYTRTASGWAEQAMLTPTSGEEVGKGEFGTSVAVSADGNTVLVGAPAAAGSGAVWAFKRSGSSWTQDGEEITGAEVSAGDQFGRSVALSANGEDAVVGAPGDSSEAGAVWAFARPEGEGAWSQQGLKLTPELGEETGSGQFGASVALSAEGDTALVGAPADNGNLGAAWVLTRMGTLWSQQGTKLTGAEELEAGRFGASVALDGEGSAALIGGPGDSEGAGAAWAFARSGSSWSQQTKLTASTPVASSAFGTSVALSAAGSAALVGGPGEGEEAGAAWVFQRSEGTFTQHGSTLHGAAESGKGRFGAAVALSADGAGVLVGGPADNSAAGAAWGFADPPTVATTPPSSLTQTSATLNATVNPNGGEVSDCHFEYGPSTSYGESAPCSALPESSTTPEEVSAPVANLTPNTKYYVRIVASNGGGTSTDSVGQSFKTLPDAPSVLTEAASALTQTTATLNATVNPNGASVSSCKLEYGPSASYGSSVACSPAPGSGDSAVAVSAAVTGLSADTTYHFRVVATNAGGTSEGSDQTFATLPDAPSVITKEVSSVDQSAATLNATVNPNGAEVSSCEFEYGTTSSYGSSAPCSSLPGSGAEPVAVSAALHGLSANTTYHFRVVAKGTGGTSRGADASFKTLPQAPTVVTGAASAVTQTTATLKATVNPNGGSVSDCELEYGPTESYGSHVACSPSPGSGNSAVAVSAAVTGLSANATYHFRVVATNAGGTSEGADRTFKTLPNAPTVTTGAASAVAQTTTTLNATVNPNGAEVSSCEFEYGTTSSYGSSAPCSSLPGSGTEAVGVAAALKGLAANTTYHFRIVATNAGGTSEGSDRTFKTLPAAPTVVTGAASAVAQTTATLNATVNPNGGSVSDCKLEYGPSTSYGSSVACTPSPGSGNSAVAVSAAVTGLSANTTYHFRVVATNAGGTSEGADQTFKTLPDAPSVVTGSASAITQTTATLGASVNPNGGEVSECELEYGPTASYGSSVPCKPSPGSGNSAVAVSAAATGLSANTTYHFRVIAKNPGGTAEGSDQTFKTLPDAPVVVTGEASAIAQTAATLNATVNPKGGSVSSCKLEYGPSTSYGSSVACSPSPGSSNSAVAVSAAVTGLSANTTYHFRVVATNAGGTSEGGDETFKTLPNAPTPLTGAASAIKQTTATLNATVNPNGGEVSSCEFEYGTTESYGAKATCGSLPGSGAEPVAVSAPLNGLSANTTYHFRIVARNAGGIARGADATFKTLPNPPTVVTGSASAVQQTAATLNATVNPNGGSVTACKLEYGLTQAYGSSATCSSLPGSGDSPVGVAAALEDLSPNTTYHFRIVATNAGGTSEGSDQTLTTLPDPPTVATGSASASTQTTATLNATVNPNGGKVSGCYFEYGEGISYGSKVACAALPGAGTSPVAVSASLAGLIKDTTYHFRVVATNAGGTSDGTDQTFETAPGPPTVLAGEPSAVGQVSAMLNAEVNPNGGVVEKCYFHYEKSDSPQEAVITPCVVLSLTGKSPTKVSALAENLTASTRYSFSLEVINTFGEVAFSESVSFETLPGPSVVTKAASSVTQISAALNATVDPNGGEVSDCHFEYGTSASYGSDVPCSSLPGSGAEPVAVSSPLNGLSPNTTYYFRIVATNPGGESKDTLGQTFKTLPNVPMVVTGSASSVAQTTASLSATVNPSGGEISECKLEYGTSTSYGASVPCSSLPGPGGSPVAVSAALVGLSADTTYHFTIVASNAGGRSLPGSDQTFTTLPDAPAVVTGEASLVAQSTATLNAIVNPNGGAVSGCEFEYGSSASYGSRLPCAQSPGTGNSGVAVAVALSGLRANTTYHFRIVATNAGGTSAGGDQLLTTAPTPPPAVQPAGPSGTTVTAKSEVQAYKTSSLSTACGASLASPNVMAQRGEVSIKLSWAKASTCRGKLTLAVKARGKGGRPKLTPIGTAAFSLAGRSPQVVRVKLNQIGRELLEAEHGRLSASLTVLATSPGPARAQTATVHVVSARSVR
ncbi:MAG TPA: hypothetical protein VK756_10295 [Solirubrobacteraceae bacterium]|nr:hypothetical protein [Solirubrobacteraceae bacterium]